jgi:UDP-N-acetylglucosamine 2-epimerase (non-hydrolysing)
MIDTLTRMMPVIKRQITGIKQPYVLVTLHRPSNVDDHKILRGIMRALRRIAQTTPVIFPVHPRTAKALVAEAQRGRGDEKSQGAVIFTKPLGYLEFLNLMANAALVLTDSGGIQEETTILGVPCLTLRHNTERPITITQGTNKLVGTDPERIIRESMKILYYPHFYPTSSRETKKEGGRRPELWDGNAAKRIVKVLSLTMGRN